MASINVRKGLKKKKGSVKEGPPPKKKTLPNLFIKNYVFILTCLNFSHLQSTLSTFGAINLLRLFSTAQNGFWTCWFWYLLMFFCFTSSTSAEVSLWGRFSSRETKKKSGWGKMGWKAKVRHRNHVIFGQNLLNTQHSVGRCVVTCPQEEPVICLLQLGMFLPHSMM